MMFLYVIDGANLTWNLNPRLLLKRLFISFAKKKRSKEIRPTYLHISVISAMKRARVTALVLLKPETTVQL
jgi:hypothetical protein